MQPLRILVVEDDVDTRLNVQDVLEDEGYQVDLAPDGTTARTLLANGVDYSAVLLDLKLPDADGLELYRQAREHGSALLAIVMTAHANLNAVNQALDAGIWQLLHKPVDFGELLPLIRSARMMNGSRPMWCEQCETKTSWFHRDLALYFCSAKCLDEYPQQHPVP